MINQVPYDPISVSCLFILIVMESKYAYAIRNLIFKHDEDRELLMSAQPTVRAILFDKPTHNEYSKWFSYMQNAIISEPENNSENHDINQDFWILFQLMVVLRCEYQLKEFKKELNDLISGRTIINQPVEDIMIKKIIFLTGNRDNIIPNYQNLTQRLIKPNNETIENMLNALCELLNFLTQKKKNQILPFYEIHSKKEYKIFNKISNIIKRIENHKFSFGNKNKFLKKDFILIFGLSYKLFKKTFPHITEDDLTLEKIMNIMKINRVLPPYESVDHIIVNGNRFDLVDDCCPLNEPTYSNQELDENYNREMYFILSVSHLNRNDFNLDESIWNIFNYWLQSKNLRISNKKHHKIIAQNSSGELLSLRLVGHIEIFHIDIAQIGTTESLPPAS